MIIIFIIIIIIIIIVIDCLLIIDLFYIIFINYYITVDLRITAVSKTEIFDAILCAILYVKVIFCLHIPAEVYDLCGIQKNHFYI